MHATTRPTPAPATLRLVRAPGPGVGANEATDAIDAEILDLVRAGATGRQNAATHRRALREKAGLFIDVAHFCRLCIGDLLTAFGDDREARRSGAKTTADGSGRLTRNRRRSWLAAFRAYARHAGIERGLEIVALDRQGHYACRLIDKAPTDDWAKLVRLAEEFGIDEERLKGCLPAEAAKWVAGEAGK